MQAYLQDLHFQQDLQNEVDEAGVGQQSDENEAASRQRSLAIEQLKQQALAQQQQLKDVEADSERYKALLEDQRQKTEVKSAPLDAYLAKYQPKLDAGFQRCKDVEQHLEAYKIRQRYSLIPPCKLSACSLERKQI